MRSMLTLSASVAVDYVHTMPPSPKPPKFLLGKNEKQPRSPMVPANFFVSAIAIRAPQAWATSSTI